MIFDDDFFFRDSMVKSEHYVTYICLDGGLEPLTIIIMGVYFITI